MSLGDAQQETSLDVGLLEKIVEEGKGIFSTQKLGCPPSTKEIDSICSFLSVAEEACHPPSSSFKKKTLKQLNKQRKAAKITSQTSKYSDINENKTKYGGGVIKRITRTQPTPITTSNKSEELKEMEIENKTPTRKTQNQKKSLN